MKELFEVFYSPGKAFDQIRERTLFLPGLIAVVLTAVVSFGVLVTMIGMETMARKQIESNPRMVEQMGPEKVEQAVQAAGSPTRKTIGYCAAVLITVISMFSVAGLCLGGLMLMGGKANYLQVVGAVCYSWFPYSLINLVMMATILKVAPDRDSLDIRNLVATNIGAFLNKETTGKAVISIANSIDLLSFGEIALLSYGLSKVARVSFGQAAIIVLGLWAVYVAGKTAISAI